MSTKGIGGSFPSLLRIDAFRRLDEPERRSARCPRWSRNRKEGSWSAGSTTTTATCFSKGSTRWASRHFFHHVKRFTITAYHTSEVGLEALGHRTSFRTFEGYGGEERYPLPGGVEAVGLSRMVRELVEQADQTT